MSIARFFALSAVVAATSCAFADAANVLVSFSTTADKYADGTPVKDGEWYALCWSADGVFEGLKADVTPEDGNDLVIMMASLAKDGKCPYTVFQIDSQSPKCKRTGVYTVILLDTRDGAGKVAATKPTSVNAALVAQNYTAGSAMAGTSKKSTASAQWAAQVDPKAEGFKPATIKGFKVIDDAKVEIEIENMLPGVQYNVKMGSKLDKLDTYGLETPADVTNAKFIIDKGDAKFFQLTREPLTK